MKYEEQEDRRLDLIERELALKERAVDAEIQKLREEIAAYKAGIESQVEDRVLRREAEEDYHRQILADQERHAGLLERIAVALEGRAT